jgi:hypothetical protein
MAKPNKMVAHVSMNYSDKAKKVYFNANLGNTQLDIDNAYRIINSFKEEGFVAEPISDNKGNVIPGSIRVIFTLTPNQDGLIDWDEFKDDYFGEDGQGGEKEILNELFNMIEDYKYTISDSDKKIVESTPQVVEGTRKALKNANGNNVTSMINNFFENLHSPQVQKLLNSIKVITNNDENNTQQDIGNVDKGSAKAILATQALSVRNTVWIISQWLNYNKTGTPTMIATANQWQNIGRYVSNGATPLVALMPYRYNGDEMGEIGASDLFGGVTRNDAYNMDKGVGRAFDRKSKHQKVNDGNYGKVIYYDISDTDVINQRLWNNFAKEAQMSNISHEFNQKAQDLMSDNEKSGIVNTKNKEEVDNVIKDLDIKDNAVNIKLTLEAITDLVGNNKIYADTINLIKTKPDDINDILISYYSHNDNIDREKNAKKKSAKLDICVSVTELELHIGMVDVAAKWANVSHFFETPNEVIQMSNNTAVLINAVRKKQEEYLMAENRILKESDVFTFNDFLNDLGVSDVELKQQLQSNKDAQELANEQREIKESFTNMWNRIIDANKKNHGTIC